MGVLGQLPIGRRLLRRQTCIGSQPLYLVQQGLQCWLGGGIGRLRLLPPVG